MSKRGKISGKQIVKMSAFLLTAAVVAPVAKAATLSCPVSLLFGNYTTCNSTETSTISPGNSRTVSGCLSAGAAPYNRAQCNISQSFPATTVVFSITAGSANITNSTADKMTIDNFSCRFQGSAGTSTGACNHSTTGFFLSIDVGSRLTVNNPQGAGNYSGSFTVQTNFP